MSEADTPDTAAELVLVSWVDAASVNDRWKDREEAIKEGIGYVTDPILACGFLIAERDDALVIALTYNHHNDDVSHCMSIPRAAVTSIIRLKGVAGSKMPRNVTRKT